MNKQDEEGLVRAMESMVNSIKTLRETVENLHERVKFLESVTADMEIRT